MHWLSVFAAAVLFAAACNLDTALLAMGYAARGVHLKWSQALLLAGLTTFITWLSLILGVGTARAFSGRLPGLLGGLALVGIGLWLVLDWLRSLGTAEGPQEQAGPAGIWDCLSLGAALAVNNAGIGVAAGASGIAPGWAALANFLVTLAALGTGRLLGGRLAGRLLGRYALPLSGALLVALGIWEALS